MSDLDVEPSDQPTQRHHRLFMSRTEIQGVQLFITSMTPRSFEVGGRSLLAQHHMDLTLEPGLQPGQLVAESDQLPQLPEFRWSNPTFRQRGEPEQIRRQVSVLLVVSLVSSGVCVGWSLWNRCRIRELRGGALTECCGRWRCWGWRVSLLGWLSVVSVAGSS